MFEKRDERSKRSTLEQDSTSYVSQALVTGELLASGQELTRLPPVVLACCGLRVLDVSANCLTQLPQELTQLQSLSVLDASFNQLHEVPACVGQLTCLTALRLQFNTIEFVHPEAFGGGFAAPPISATAPGALSAPLSPAPALSPAPPLVELLLHDNALGALPASVSRLTCLTRLELQYNRLAVLPPQLGALSECLRLLNVEGNQLQLQHNQEQQHPSTIARPGSAAPLGTGHAGGGGGGTSASLTGQQLQAGWAQSQAQREVLAAAAASSSSGGGGGEVGHLREALGRLAMGMGMAAAGHEAQGTDRQELSAGEDGEGGFQRRTAGLQSSPEILQLHGEDGGFGVGGVAVTPQPRLLIPPPQPAHGAALWPQSPVMDLRNSHADLELLNDADEQEQQQQEDGNDDQGLGKPHPGAPERLSHLRPPCQKHTQRPVLCEEDILAGPASELQRTGSGPFPSHVGVGLSVEELAALPPAAAAALYRSMEVVAGGIQEMRQGRPLSRGGACASATALPPPSSARPPGTSSGTRRPGSAAALRPASAAAGGGPWGPTRPASRGQAATSHVGTRDNGGSSSWGDMGRPTGALALLGRHCSSGGGSSGRPDGAMGLSAPRRDAGDEAAGGSGLGAMGPITFPLAAGVRGVLRGGSGGRTGSGGVRQPASGVGAAPWPDADATPAAGGVAVGDAVAEEDALATVRRLLAGRAPELLAALDERVLADGEEDEGGPQGSG